jgi:tetratricopeptide (TPR) repeat protein
VVEKAAELARSGEITAAVQAYGEALALDPDLGIDPQQEANRQYAPAVISQAGDLARSGEITASLSAISQALQLDPYVAIGANTWNGICWNGSLNGEAGKVLAACEVAVAAAPDDGTIRDSRGLARALTGDIAGAIEDFEFVVEWARETGYDASFIASREGWIAELRAGRAPFDEETLARLREE